MSGKFSGAGGKGKLHLKAQPDGYGFIYGVWVEGEESVRVDIMPPRAHWDGDMMLPGQEPHATDWVVFANGVEIARVKAENVMGIEDALRALAAPMTRASKPVAVARSSSLWRALLDPVWWAILLAIGIGYFDQRSAWAIMALGMLAVLLTLWSCVSDGFWWREFRSRELLPALVWFWLQCLMQNAGFVLAAYVAGHGTRWLWGVPWQ